MFITQRAACALILVTAGALGQIEPLTNDSCTTPLPLAIGINPAPSASGHTYTNSGATDSPGFTSSCQSNVHADVFFAFTAQTSGPHEVRTDAPPGFVPGTLSDTVLQVFSGCGGSTELACDDDSGAGLLSRIAAVPLVAGITYTIRVSSFGVGPTGTFYLRVNPPPGIPANDTCAGAFALTDGTSVGSNAAATSDAPSLPPSSCAVGDRHVWYAYTNPGSCGRTVTVSTCGPQTNFDTVLAVYGGTCGALVGVACNDDTCGTRSTVTFVIPPGATRRISVASYFASGGTFALSVASTIAQAESMGAACGVIAPTLAGDLPQFGTQGSLWIGGAEANAAGLLGLSALGIPSPLPGGCTLQLDVGSAIVLAPVTIDASGNWSLTATIPNDPAFVCFEVMLQAAVSGPAGLSLTNGLRLVLGP